MILLLRIVSPCVVLAITAFLLWLYPPTPDGALAKTLAELCTRSLGCHVGSCLGLLATGLISMCTSRFKYPLTACAALFALVAGFTFLASDVCHRMLDSQLAFHLPITLVLFLFSCLLLSSYAPLWTLIARPLQSNLRPLHDGTATFFALLFLLCCTPISLAIGDLLSQIHENLAVTFCVIFGVLLFATFLHFLWVIGQPLVRKAASLKRILWAWPVLATLVFPLGGLILNIYIPFPYNFQSPLCYLFTILTAATLLLPDQKGVAGILLTFARWATFPFTLYFCIVFLPFMLLALPGLLVFGAGIFLLAPAFLMSVHVPTLKRTLKSSIHPIQTLLIALAGFALLPTIFFLSVERDRAEVQPLIEAIAHPNTTTDDLLPTDEATARRITTDLAYFNSDRGLPLLTAYRNFRLYKGMSPKAEVLNALCARLEVDSNGEPFPSFTNRSFTSNIRFENKEPLATEVRGVGTCQLTIALTLPALKDVEEFRAPIHLDDGVWVTGLRLKMPNNGPWHDGLLCDRRAATWVYERLTARSLDPALLTLDTLTDGTLRVSPVNEPREVEIDLLLPSPDWSATPLTLGDTPIHIPGILTPEVVDPRATATVCFVGANAPLPLPDATLYVTTSPHIAVRETPPTTIAEEEPYDIDRAIRFARGAAYARNLRITEAIFVGEGWEDATFIPEPPRRPLPKLAPDSQWQHGAIAAQLSEALRHAPHPDYAEPLHDALQHSKALMPNFAYIVVETEEQERTLRTLDFIAKNKHQGFSLETLYRQSSPPFLFLFIPLLIFTVYKHLKNVSKPLRSGEPL